MMDSKAKRALLALRSVRPPEQTPFPLEPIAIFAGRDKITSDSGSLVHFWAQQQLARSYYLKKNILDGDAFAQVDWGTYYAALHKVPRLFFQLWACKQTMGIAGTNKARSRFTKDASPLCLCPSCNTEEETCGHILRCTESGRVAP